MKDGFVWCPHCKNPHALGVTRCPQTQLPLGRSLHSRIATPVPGGPIGATIAGKYRVTRLIGAGGMGRVFEAEHLQLRRPVAIKVVAGARAEEALLRLRSEAQLVAAIQHPNICDIYDVGTLPDGSPYLVLERLVGETLAACLKRERRLSNAAALDVFSQLLSGLDAAHAARIVHRDLKPENVFLSRRVGCRPHVKLMDFGFAKDLTGSRSHAITRPGRALGTPRYMAPEQLAGEAVDARTDLFAVGVMIFEALTGVHPFRADSLIELQAKILHEPPLELRSIRPDLPKAFEDVLLQTLAKDPAQRLASATRLQRALVRTLGASAPSDADEAPVSQTLRMRFSDSAEHATPV